jgi:hypothetical protein
MIYFGNCGETKLFFSSQDDVHLIARRVSMLLNVSKRY